MPVELYSREAGTGLPLVLLHAFPLSSAMWLAQREGLSGVCRVITPDLRGWGGSPLGGEDPSIDLMADDVAALLDSKNIDRAVVGGQSMGGYVAMAFLRRHPDRVLGLILADTKAGADPEAARANRERSAARVLADERPDVLLEEVLPGLVGSTTKERRALVYGRVRGLVQSAPPPAAAWSLRAMASRPDSFEMLRKARVPALVLVGEEDQLSPVADAEATADALPEARMVTIPDAGHLTAVEQPEAFNEAVREFVAGLPRTAA
ncbi:MAG: alpha/beta fold hydrolase [Streptosporangiales bacterium]|nr:alpha/beta fold hydrolase [Streptosporangiales bacterium]